MVFGPIVWTFTLDIGNIRLACNESEYSGLKSLVVKDNQSSESRLSKGGFFSESAICFPNLQKIYSKNYPELEIKISRQYHFSVLGGKFQFQAQDSFLEYFFWRIGDLKNESHFLKKSHL